MKLHRARVGIFVASVIVAALMSIGHEASGQQGNPAHGRTPGVTDSEIKIGAWYAFTGPAAAYLSVGYGADAYFKYINDRGGINGRKITYIMKDDGYQPSRTIAVAKELVEKDKVFAIVSPLGTSTNLAVKPYMLQTGVPVIFPVTGVSKAVLPLKKTYFGMQTTYLTEGEVDAKYAVEKLGHKRIGVFYQSDDVGLEPLEGLTKGLEKRGMKVAKAIPYNMSDVNFNSQALQMKEANPDIVMLYGVPKPVGLFIQAMARLNYHPPVLGSYVLNDPVMFDTAGKAWEGAIVGAWLPPVDGNDQQAKLFRDSMKKYHPETKPGYLASIGWAEAQVFVEAVQRAGKDLTRESLINSLEGIKEWKGGLIGEVTFGPDKHLGQNALYFMKASKRTYKKVSDWISITD